VVFEDDGETGYVYALDARKDEDSILDALHIYNTASVTEADADCLLEFVWSEDEGAVAVVIDDYAHAFIDFHHSLAMCANEFPPVAAPAFAQSHAWDEEAFKRRFPNLESDWSWRQQQGFTQEQIDALTGSKLLVGLTYLRPDGEVEGRVEFAGTVYEVGPDVVSVRRHDTGEVFTLPPAPEAFQPAEPGDYRLRSTGEVIVNPDFICTMTVQMADNGADTAGNGDDQ
jgi:hypothetical protein